MTYRLCTFSLILHISHLPYSLGIRQKGESQNGCFKKAKQAKISEKQTFLTPNQEVRNFCFSEILACFAFLKNPFRDLPFCLIIDELTFFQLWFLSKLFDYYIKFD